MGSVRLTGVEKRFGAHAVLSDINLSIDNGEFIVLVGPSGCGKSTLLRMIAGLETISAGEILIDGVRANDVPPQHRDVAMVFQSYALFPHYTAEGNMAFGPRLRHEEPRSIAERVANAARMLNLEDYLPRRPVQLSGGQRQRVAMGRAIVREPSLFLFDEPLSNLDAKLRVAMRAEIKALHRKLGTTIIYVTHDQVEAMTMADRIVVMRDGSIEQEGRPLDVYDRPANTFVAGFIGSPAMGFVEGIYDASGIVTTSRGTHLAVAPNAARSGSAVVAGLRPEDIVISNAADGMAAEITLVEPTGPETHVYAVVDGSHLTVTCHGRVDLEPGATVRLSVAPELVHLFAAGSGARISG